MTNKLNKIFYLCIFISFSIFSSDTIQTGRPGQSIGAGIVAQKYFQLQTGIEKSEIEISNVKSNATTLNNILRYGINKKYEISMVVDANHSDSSDTEIGNLQFGGRVALIDKSEGLLPKLCFQTRLQFLDGAGDKNSEIKIVSIVSGVYDLNESGAITTNLLLNNLNQDNYEFIGYNLSWSKNLNEKLSYFLEYYSRKSNDEWLGYIDSGFGYLVNNDLALDIAIGADIEEDLASKFVSVGFSWRRK